MPLAEFILKNIEPILSEWEAYARGIWPGTAPSVADLRDDVEDILRATVRDMQTEQSAVQQSSKSKGNGCVGQSSEAVNAAAAAHGLDRGVSGYDLMAVIAEYRALRASVLRLWRESDPQSDLQDVDDLTRFNESIDQSLAVAVGSYYQEVEREREALRAREHALREEAEGANRAKDLFLATLSHELRTPLNAIAMWTHLLRSANYKEAELLEGLTVIDRSVKTQVQLIADVLDVSRIVSGKLRMEIGPCDLFEVVNLGVDSVRPAAMARGIGIDLQLDPVARVASCDGSRIQQVVWNLVSNAVKFTPKEGRITVMLNRDHSSFRIQVSDSGEGISNELLPYVFDRFRQADSSDRRKFGGLGLGLSIVKHIVEQHGGTVTAHSAGEGRGSSFIVHLPIRALLGDDLSEQADSGRSLGNEPGEVHSTKAISVPKVRLNGLRVLVVDDELDARHVLGRVLENAGAVVTAAGSAAEAFSLLTEVRPDVLVSDLAMPGEDGYDLIRRVRASGYDAMELPAVALTAFARQEDYGKSLEAGFQSHVSKPVQPRDLIAVIGRLMGRAD